MSRIVAKSGVSGKVLPAIDQVAEVFGRSPVDLTRLVDHAPESRLTASFSPVSLERDDCVIL